MSFHAKDQAVKSALAQTLEDNPHLAERAQELDRHYMLGGREKPSPLELYAALRLHADESYKEVTRHMSQQFRMVIDRAEGYVISAVNRGPSFLKEDEDFLHGKGIMRGSDKYYLGYKGIHTGGTYDRAWQAIDPAHRPIVAEAVTAALSPKHKAMEKRVLKYVAVLLMPEGDAKLFMLNKLSIKSEKKHGAYVRQACDFIRAKANEFGINVSETLMADKAASHPLVKIPAPLGAVKKSNGEAKPVNRDFTGGAASPAPKPAAPAIVATATEPDVKRDMVTLKRQLKALEHRGKISEKEAKIYFWLQDGPEDEPRSMADAARRIGKPERNVQIMMAKVNLALRGFEQAAPSSDRNLHKAGAVRP